MSLNPIVKIARLLTAIIVLILLSYGIARGTASWLSYFVAYSTISSDMKQYSDKLQQDYILETKQLKQLQNIELCDNNSQSVLRTLEYKSNEIRFLGVKMAEHLCTSNGLIDFPTIEAQQFPYVRYVSPITKKKETSVLINVNDKTFLVDSNEADFAEYFVYFCNKCLSFHYEYDVEHHKDEVKPTTWFVVHGNLGNIKGVIVVDRYLQQKLNEQNFYYYWLVYFLLLCLIAAGIVYYYNTLHDLQKMLVVGCKKNEFIPYYQPIMSLDDKLQGVEVLVRWKLSDGSLLLPAYFIEVAEQMEVINEITITLVKKVQADFRRYSSNYNRKVFCAFNLTAQQIENKSFINLLILTLKKEENFVPSFEITERQHFNNLALAKANIRRLQEQGYQVKLDDAGTGYGGFSYFMDFNLDGVKIDKMFIDVIGVDDVKVEVLNSIIMMAKRLGIDIVAEGVETQQQVDFLRKHNIDYIQGYYYSKPVPFKDLNFDN